MNIWKRGVCLLLTLVMAAALAGCGTLTGMALCFALGIGVISMAPS